MTSNQNITPAPSSVLNTERNNNNSQEKMIQPSPAPQPNALKLNLIEHGMQEKVNDVLLNQNRVDFRATFKEIVKEYPFSKIQ